MGPIQRVIIRDAVMSVVRHPRLTLVIAAILLLVGTGLAWTHLTISTDQNKLFSAKVPFFHQYLEFIREFPENEAVYITLQARNQDHPPSTRQWIQCANAVAQRVAGLHQYVNSVDSHVPLKQLGRQALLFADWPLVKKAAAQSNAFAVLGQLWGQKPNMAERLLGSSRLERFLRLAAEQTPSTEAAKLLVPMMESLRASLQSPATRASARRFGLANLSRLIGGARTDPSAWGYYYFPEANNSSRYLLVIRVYPHFTYDSLAAISTPLTHIDAAIKSAAQPYAAEFTVGLTGRAVLSSAEMKITTHDTDLAEVVAMLTVLAGLILMLRSVWLAMAASVSLAVAIGWTFGYATLAVGQLNLLSTVFVIALIGIGMDYLIQIVIRYRREVRRYQRPLAVWVRVFRYTGPPVITACLGAAGAFWVANLTAFRGAAELGVIAGGGLLLCLLAGYTVLPALLVLFPPKFKPVHAAARYPASRAFKRSKWLRFSGLIVWLALLFALLPWAIRLRFDPNLLDLQARGLECVKLVKKLPTWSAVLLSKQLSNLKPVNRRLVKAASFAGSPILSVSSLLDAQAKQQYLDQHGAAIGGIRWSTPHPLTAADLSAVAAAASQLATVWSKGDPAMNGSLKKSAGIVVTDLHQFVTLVDRASAVRRARQAHRVSQWQRNFAAQIQLIAQTLCPGPLNLAEIPASLRRHYVSKTGIYALYIQPRFNLWRQHNLREFVHVLQGVHGRDGLVPPGMDLTGIAPQIYDSTRAIRDAFIKATVYALILVVILVFLDMRRIGQTLVTISVLGLGLPMLACLMGVLHIDWNFANFFGLPILIGAGHEYGVFMVHRYREAVGNPRRVWRFWDVSERALLMCGFVTCSSFGFLALGRDRGIASLGLVMALGIGCIYMAAEFVLRPLLQWKLEHNMVVAAPEDSGDEDA
jgi:predicted RND superfamily exporter protein